MGTRSPPATAWSLSETTADSKSRMGCWRPVASVYAGRGSVTLTTDAGKVVPLDPSYLQEGQLSHAYALTAHKAQGMTVDRAFVRGSDELYREWGYTALSRRREEARFYVTAPADQQALRGLEPVDDPIAEELQRTLGRSRAKELGCRCQRLRGAAERSLRRLA